MLTETPDKVIRNAQNTAWASVEGGLSVLSVNELLN